MPMLRTIDRPTNATLRPCAWAWSSTCWMRCTWLAKLETITRRGASRNAFSMAGTSSPSDIVKPGTSALVESVRKRSTPSSPRRAKARRAGGGEAAQVGDPAVQRELVHLEVAGVQDQPRRRPDRHGQRVGDRVVDR